MGYIDSHCHLCDEHFESDLQEVITRAKDAHIEKMLIICSRLSEVPKALALKEKDDSFDIAVGIHPVDVQQFKEEDWETFVAYASDCRVCAIGEIGLDYHWYPETKQLQKELFIRQIELANELQKPIIVHSRDAIQDTYEILTQHPTKGVIHSFSGSKEMALQFIKKGYYIGLGGPVTFKNALVPKEVASEIPIDYLLTETDSPYLTPTPYRGQRNEPSYVTYTANMICSLKNMQQEILTQHIKENYYRLFYGKN